MQARPPATKRRTIFGVSFVQPSSSPLLTYAAPDDHDGPSQISCIFDSCRLLQPLALHLVAFTPLQKDFWENSYIISSTLGGVKAFVLLIYSWIGEVLKVH